MSNVRAPARAAPTAAPTPAAPPPTTRTSNCSALDCMRITHLHALSGGGARAGGDSLMPTPHVDQIIRHGHLRHAHEIDSHQRSNVGHRIVSPGDIWPVLQ